MCLTLKSDKVSCLKLYVEAEFAVHLDFKSHTWAPLIIEKGAILSVSQNKKLHTKISTEAELVGADYASSLILWTNILLESQGYKSKQNVLY